MDIDTLLQANFETHWCAVNQDNQLELIEKDDRFTRLIKTVLGQIIGHDFYSHIRFDSIAKASFVAVANEQKKKVVSKYLELTGKIKNCLSAMPSLEEEKQIVARYNWLVVAKRAVVEQLKKPFLQFDDVQKIVDCVHDVCRWTQGVTYHKSQDNHEVFSIQDAGVDRFMFKMKRRDDEGFSMRERLKNSKKGRAVRKEHNLNLTSVPPAEIIKVYKAGRVKDLLVEKKLNLAGKYSQLEEQTKRELVRQLTIFVLHTGTSDIAERNFPLAVSKKQDFEKIKAALIDLEEMDSVYTGLFGGVKRHGLLDIFPSVKDAIYEEIENHIGAPVANLSFERDHGVHFDDFPKSSSRLMEIADELYRHVTVARKCDADVKGKAAVFVGVNNENSVFYNVGHTLNLDTDKKPHNFGAGQDQEYYDATLIGIVVKEFERLGLVSGVSSRTGHGWTIDL